MSRDKAWKALAVALLLALPLISLATPAKSQRVATALYFVDQSGVPSPAPNTNQIYSRSSDGRLVCRSKAGTEFPLDEARGVKGAYDSATSSAQNNVLLSASKGGMVWRDASSPISDPLARFTNFGDSVSYFAVQPSQLTTKTHAAFTSSDSILSTVAVQTTDATATQLLTVSLADNTVYSFRCEAAARGTAGAERALYGKAVLVYRQAAGAATIQGAVQSLHTDVETTGSMDGTFTVSSNSLRFTVTGIAATTINWTATCTYQGVSGSS